jgi:hypothetical protein
MACTIRGMKERFTPTFDPMPESPERDLRRSS